MAHVRSTPISSHFWVVVTLLALAFLTGGSSRADVESLVILNPLMVVAVGAALVTLRREHLAGRMTFLVVILAVVIAIPLYALPSPFEAGLTSADKLLSEIFSAVQFSTAPSNAMAVAPYRVWQSLVSLATPLAIFLYAVQLPRDDQYRLLPVCITIAVISGVLGLMQQLGSTGNALHLYRVTNEGSAVGLFANRNHAAVFLACMFPILAVFALASQQESSSRMSRPFIAVTIAIFFAPLILVTGSRSGMLIAAIGTLGGLSIYLAHERTTNRGSASAKMALITLAAIIVISTLTVYLSRAVAIERFFEDGDAFNNRGDFWAITWSIVQTYMPFGTGPGGFVESYQIAEPITLLDSTYLNRAHNDWLETAANFGAPAVALLAGGLVMLIRRTIILWTGKSGGKRLVSYAKMAGIVLAMLAIASISDYPLRTPAMMAFAVIIVIWFTTPPKEA